ncbi:MAG: (2Fe-2S)-binding protein [Burkholderiaceae bacterium]|nr:(2Fe-2S)-binding protein [Burkholderiaceae bacterium]
MNFTLKVNAQTHTVDVDPTTPLLWVLRDNLGLTGTKYGCGIEICAACTVLVGGEKQKSCHLEIKEVQGREVTTVEGLSPNRSHPLQKAWIAEQVPQCGFCQSGMLMSAALLKKNARPSDAAIDSACKNICVRHLPADARRSIARPAIEEATDANERSAHALARRARTCTVPRL